MDADFDIAVMGWGTRGVEQMTVEQLRTLGQSAAIAVDPGATESIRTMLAAYSAHIEDLAPLYANDHRKADVYPRMVERVLELQAAYGPTAWLTYGHPLLYSRPSQLLIAACSERDLRLSVLTGISSLAEIMSVLGLDISSRGLQVYFADQLVRERPPIHTDSDLVVMQPGGLCEERLCRDFEARQRRDVSAYRELQAFLEPLYPKGHALTSICLSEEPNRPHEVFEAPLSSITELAPRLHYGHTWLISAR